MPDMLAHYLVAEAAAPQAGGGAGRLVDRAFDAYKVGAQGPDVFFYSHVLRPRRRSGYARLTHQRRVAASFASMLAHAATLPAGGRDVAYAFVAGYAAHLCLDAQAHPWVMYWTGDITSRAGSEARARAFRRHGILEASVDVLLSRERSGDTAWLRKQRLLHLPAEQRAIVAALLSHMLDATYGAAFTPAEARSAFRSMEWIYATMSDPRALSTRLLGAAAPLSRHGAVVRGQIYPEVPPPTAAGLYAGRRPWRHPFMPDAPRTETFAELTGLATREAVGCLEAVAAVADGDAEVADAVAVIGDRNMFTGLPCGRPPAAAAFAPHLELLWEDGPP